MEHQLWKSIVGLLASFGKPRKRRATAFTDQDIVAVYYWAVIHDRPTAWACRPAHWPVHLRGRALPCPGTMSRRLRSAAVVALLDALERRLVAPKEPGLFWMIDGKPLVIGGCSKDRQAGYGRAAGGKAKGYKIHALVGAGGAIAQWRVAPMNKDERVMAERLVKAAPAEVVGYVVADSNFDSNPLHKVCEARGGPAIGHPQALRAREGDRTPPAERRSAAFDGVDGEPLPGVRRATAPGPCPDRTLLRPDGELGGRLDVLAGLGADAAARPPLGPGQARPDGIETYP